MTDKLQIYKCEVCGNIVEMVHEGKGELVCCDQPMKLIVENTVDAALEQLNIKNGSPKIILGEGKDVQVIELTEDEVAKFEGDGLFDKVFSAKVTARKPLK